MESQAILESPGSAGLCILRVGGNAVSNVNADSRRKGLVNVEVLLQCLHSSTLIVIIVERSHSIGRDVNGDAADTCPTQSR